MQEIIFIIDTKNIVKEVYKLTFMTRRKHLNYIEKLQDIKLLEDIKFLHLSNVFTYYRFHKI